MSLFTEFVSTLLPDERNVLAELPVRGKQSAILHAVVKNPLNDEHLRKEMAKLKVSPAYLHSVQSALLRRAYDLFVPSGGIDLLLFLRIRGLDVHFKHELNTQERALEAHNASLEERHEFYLRLLNLLFAVSTLRFEPKLILAVLSLYERTIVIPHPDDKLHIRICKALAEVVSTSGSPTRIDRTPRRKDVLERLTALKDELGESDHHLARYHIDYAFAVYYAIIEGNPILSEQYVITLANELKWLPEAVRRDELPKVMLRKAGLLFMHGKFSEALDIYISQYNDCGIELFRMYGFHRDWFIRCGLAARSYRIVQEVLDKGYAPLLHRGRSATATAGQMHQTALYLLRGDNNEARRSLKKAYTFNKGSNFVLILDVYLRFIELALEVLSGADHIYLDRLFDRTIKYLSRKGMKLKDGGDILLFYALRDLYSGNKRSEYVQFVYREGFQPYPVFIHFLRMIEKTKARRRSRALGKH